MDQTCTHTKSDGGCSHAENLDDTGIIPFADEVEVERPAVEAAADPEPDSVIDAFGDVPKRQSVADRELGIDRFSWRREGKYECPCCGNGTSRVMRVRVARQPGWSAVCAVCAATLLARLPGTIVGGMVRPTRRRRKAVSGVVAHGFRGPAQGGYRHAG